MKKINVMARAWEIAKEGKVRYGGKVREYFAAALRRAWMERKNGGLTVTWELPADSRKGKTWMARIVGTHPTYGLDRKFLDAATHDVYGDKIFLLADGIYECFTGKRRAFFVIDNGTHRMVERSEVMAHMAA